MNSGFIVCRTGGWIHAVDAHGKCHDIDHESGSTAAEDGALLVVAVPTASPDGIRPALHTLEQGLGTAKPALDFFARFLAAEQHKYPGFEFRTPAWRIAWRRAISAVSAEIRAAKNRRMELALRRAGGKEMSLAACACRDLAATARGLHAMRADFERAVDEARLKFFSEPILE